MRRAAVVAALACAACGDNLGPPPLAEPDAAAPITTAQWSMVGVAGPTTARAVWDPDRQVLVASTNTATWERRGEIWVPSRDHPAFPTKGLYFDEARHQIGAIGGSTTAPPIPPDAVAQSWNGHRWQALARSAVTGSPVAATYDPRRGRPLVFTIANDEQLNAYAFADDESVFLGALPIAFEPQSVAAIYDRVAGVALVAGFPLGWSDARVIGKLQGTVWKQLVAPVDLIGGFAFGTVDDHAELVAAGAVYRFADDAWTLVVDGLPTSEPPTALWQTRDGDRHVLFPSGEYRLHDAAWVATPLLTDNDSLAIAVAPDGDHYDLFSSATTNIGASPTVEHWRLADATVAFDRAVAAPPRRGAFAVAAPGRGRIVYGGGSGPGDTDVFAFDGQRMVPLVNDPHVHITALGAAYDPIAHRVLAIATDPLSPTLAPRIVALADGTASWTSGPALPESVLSGQTVVAVSLAYDPKLAHAVAAQQIGFDANSVSNTGVFDLVGEVWKLDDDAPFGSVIVAADERYGSLVTVEQMFGGDSWERTAGDWQVAPPPPYVPGLRVAGTAYDPAHHELGVLAHALDGWVLFVRHRD